MRKLFIAAALLLAGVGAATAQGVCAGFGGTGPASLVEAEIKLTCLPAWAGGVGQGYGQAMTLDGGVAWVYCPAPAEAPTRWALFVGVRTWSEIAVQAPRFTLALLEADRLEAVNLMADSLGWGDFAAPELKRIWCPSWATMIAAKPTGFPPGYVPPPPPPPPPPPAWIVAKNSTFSDRPAFRVTNGVRSLSSTARTAVGSGCDESVKLIEGRSTYLKVTTTTPQTGTFVGICTQSTP